jgi:sulfide:quinone oxidoreductase
VEKSAAPRVVIVGGGSAGITVAARLRQSLPTAKVTVIEPADKHYYQPLWTLVGAGVVDKRDTERDEASLIPDGVTWLRDTATAFDPEHNQVQTRGHGRIDYDFLVVAAGIQIDWAKVRGLPEALGRDGVCSNYSYDYVDKTWEFIRGFTGGDAIFTFPQGGVKCGGAPQKIMYLADDAFRRAGVRQGSRITFASALPTLFAVPKYTPALQRVIERKGITTKFQHNLIEVRPASREAVFLRLDKNEEVVLHYDLLHVAPPQSAPDFIKQSPLAGPTGYVDVDRHTLQHTRYPNIFALGDASNLPTSKTGAAVRMQAPVLVRNLVAAAAGQALGGHYNGYTSCPLITGYGKVILAEFDYDLKPVETFPFDQSQERYSMYLLKRHVLPQLYWHGMLRGRA